MKAQKWLIRIFTNPVSRIVFGMVFVALPIQGVQELAKGLRESNGWADSDD